MESLLEVTVQVGEFGQYWSLLYCWEQTSDNKITRTKWTWRTQAHIVQLILLRHKLLFFGLAQLPTLHLMCFITIVWVVFPLDALLVILKVISRLVWTMWTVWDYTVLCTATLKGRPDYLCRYKGTLENQRDVQSEWWEQNAVIHGMYHRVESLALGGLKRRELMILFKSENKSPMSDT